ncbi:MAG TPA: ATP-dependent DNA helicase, partial [Nanoarchaeota archaeon]|nr:ATP-dependent DNA helicase [Nanoarchaeota archaeon]
MIKESETLEFKKSTAQLKEAVISISAILNKHKKGELYFGISNDGKIIGQDISEKTIRNISNAISEHIEPKIYPIITEQNKCIKVEFSGNEMPYYALGRAYIRVGDEDRKLSAKELENLILKKNKDKFRWDAEISEKAAIEDISSSKIKRFLKKIGLAYSSLENALEKLGLLHDGKPINAAMLLFGKKPQISFPNARLRCAVFATESTEVMIDMKDFYGDLFYLIEEAERYVLMNTHTGMRIEGLVRVDVPEIDKEALREAIINAFCHRDYYEYDSVNIAIFKDRVEIRNPGILYDGLTIQQIIRGNVSKRRNEIIAELLSKIHFVEKWGKGIKLILGKEPKTIFEEIAGVFIAVFKRKIDTPQKTPQK